MSDLNLLVLKGRLTRDPELSHTAGGTPVCKFGLASNDGYGDDQRTMFIDCVSFRKTAEVINEHFRKGKPILVNGKLTLNQWTDRDGNRRSKHECLVFGFDFLGQRDTAPGASQQRSEQSRDAPAGDIPF
jgi:single-strand DNA-binding protein